ncbi:MAG: immunoglobulin domain-containing protein [Limisphaerales bacterium]
MPRRFAASAFGFRISDFGFPSDFGFRISGFAMGLASCLRLLVLAALLFGAGLARAGGPVYGCTENDLDVALGQGGYVYFTQSCSITLTAPIEIVQDTILNAQGYTVSIDGGGIGPIFQVDSGITFSNIGLTISGGANTNGGAYYILDGAFVTLTNCTVSGNTAAALYGVNGINGATSLEGNGFKGQSGSPGWPALGGAIYNLGNLVLLNCALTNNSAKGGAGGVGGSGGNGYVPGGYSGGNGGSGAAGGAACGGAVFTAGLGTIMASNCTFAGNSATGGAGGQGGAGGTGYIAGLTGGGGAGAPASGGAIYSYPSRAIVEDSIFYGNSVQGGASAGGGTDVNGNGLNGKNGPEGLGGGLCCLGGAAVTNCTFYTNTVLGGAGGLGGDGTVNAGVGGQGGTAAGGGLYGTGQVSVVNCTFANCSAMAGAIGTNGSGSGTLLGLAGAGQGGGLASGGGLFLVMNSMFSTNVVAPTNGLGTNIYAVAGKITDGGYNITTDASHLWTNVHTIKNTDPKVFLPGWNGGYTMTMALSNSSPAIDAIPLTNYFPPIDQRGIQRPLGKGADIGAFELATFPAIIQQPVSVIETNGNPVQLGVSATGTSNLRLYYWWRFYGTNDTVSPTNVPGQINATYSFDSLDITNVGYYDVVISNKLGAVTSDVVSLSILPSITVQPSSIEAFERTLAWFQVTAIGEAANGDRSMSFQWQFDTLNIPGASTNQVGTNFTYTLTSVDATNGGNYTVVITNAVGGITSAIVTLSVDPVPYISPASQAVALGGAATLAVYASGEAPFTYQWQHDGTNISGVGRTYSIPGVQESDAGTYTVVVSGDFSPAYAQAFLGVGTLPGITAEPQNLAVTQGQGATLSVTATGPPLAYQWNFNGTPITDATNASYSIPIVGPANVGAYTVTISNSAGSITSNPAQLTLVSLVAPLLVEPAIQANGFNFSFQSASNITYVIQYKAHLSAANWLALATNNGTGGIITQSYPVTNGISGFYRVLVQ